MITGNDSMSIGLAILTLNAQKHLPYCLMPYLKSSLKPKILIIDSSSTDATIQIAKDVDVEVFTIPQHEFNHGATRELARKKLNTDIVAMVTQDAYAEDEFALERLCEPLLKKIASISYGRQIPHKDAGFFEAFHRSFNYPENSHIRSISDQQQYGKYTFFCSNSFAAYNNKALDEVGGFPSLLFGEDTIAAAQLLRRGHKIAYVAEAIVRHSHDYSLKEEFKRHFDIGYVRKEFESLLECDASDMQRGSSYVKNMLQQLIKENPMLIPYAVCHLGAKWLGYTLGSKGKRFPSMVKRLFSSCPSYFS